MFTDEFMLYLGENSSVGFTQDQIKTISKSLSVFCCDFDIKKKTTEISIIEEIPYAYKVYCVSKSVEGMSKRSMKTYNCHMNIFFKTVRKPIEQITTNDIRMYLYKRSQEVSQSTVNDERTILSSFFTWCVDNDYIQKNPLRGINKIKVCKKVRNALTEDELEQLRRGCKTLRDKVILETLFSTGCRVTELSNMKISDIDFQQRTIKVLRKGNKEDYVFLNPRVYRLIMEYLQQRTDNVDVLIYSNKTKTNLKACGIETAMENIVKRAKFNKKVTPHVIRHTTATIALKRGMSIEEVSKMLGHSSIETTMIYAEVNRQKLKSDHEKYVV